MFIKIWEEKYEPCEIFQVLQEGLLCILLQPLHNDHLDYLNHFNHIILTTLTTLFFTIWLYHLNHLTLTVWLWPPSPSHLDYLDLDHLNQDHLTFTLNSLNNLTLTILTIWLFINNTAFNYHFHISILYDTSINVSLHLLRQLLVYFMIKSYTL